MVTMAESAANWRNTGAHSSQWITRIHSHTLTSIQLQPRYAKRQLSYYTIWNKKNILKVPEGFSQSEHTAPYKKSKYAVGYMLTE